jgi:ribosomal protein S5
MTTLTVYGKKDGTEKVIFGNLFDSPAAMRKAKQTAQQQQYEITRAYRSGTIKTGYRATDITAEFLRA